MIPKSFKNFYLIFLISGVHFSYAQDTLTNKSPNKLFISGFFTPSFFYLEPGVQVQYFLKNSSYFELKYSFSFCNYNFLNSGNDGFLTFAKENNWNGYGSIVRFGYRYVRKGKAALTANDKIRELRITYKDLFLPAYNYPDGNSQSEYTTWYNQSEKRKVLVFNLIFGKPIYESGKFSIEYTTIIGWAISKSYFTRYYSYAGYDPPQPLINAHEELNISRPSIGFGFTFYFIAYQKNFKP
ncbi:MAG: hypothetical protein ABIT08_04115 [Bacteroidia bacterium]